MTRLPPVGDGCSTRPASSFEESEATPIGVNCRLCEFVNCGQRAEPPLMRTLVLDEATREVSPFMFATP